MGNVAGELGDLEQVSFGFEAFDSRFGHLFGICQSLFAWEGSLRETLDGDSHLHHVKYCTVQYDPDCRWTCMDGIFWLHAEEGFGIW